jgi:DNA-binding MarR family transcriptional regulator
VPASKHFDDQPDGVAGRLRIAVARIDRLLARQVLGSDLTRSQFSVLGAVVRQGQQRLADLVDREGMNPTMLSRVVGALERSGWVERLADPEDRRAVVVRATPEGTAYHQRLQRERSALLADYLRGQDDAALERIVAALPLLEELADHLQRGQVSARTDRAAG